MTRTSLRKGADVGSALISTATRSAAASTTVAQAWLRKLGGRKHEQGRGGPQRRGRAL